MGRRIRDRVGRLLSPFQPLQEWVRFYDWGWVIIALVTIFVVLMFLGVFDSSPADPGTPLDPDRAVP